MPEEPSLHDLNARVMTLEKGYQEINGKLSDIQDRLNKKTSEDARIAALVEFTKSEVEEVKTTLNVMNDKLLDAVLRGNDAKRTSDEDEKSFYRKVLIACISVLGTIVLAAFGVSKLIPLP